MGVVPAVVCRWRVEDKLRGSGFFLPHWVQAVRLGGTCLYQLSHHFSPILGFYLKMKNKQKHELWLRNEYSCSRIFLELVPKLSV